MKLGKITGTIERRILVNFRIDPDVAAKALPSPFRPQFVQGWAIGGICMIRLRSVRPSWLPEALGFSSENAAHRFAVEWDENGETKMGVYIPRRDTSSRLNEIAGGRLFPGHHGYAEFDVEEDHPHYKVGLASSDKVVKVLVKGTIKDSLPEGSAFEDLEHATEFFRTGSLGYSQDPGNDHFDGLELDLPTWNLEILDVEEWVSSYFANKEMFPEGSVELDSAYLMRDAEHEWHFRGTMCCGDGMVKESGNGVIPAGGS